ncbi:MAG: TolC family protein [Polyangiaceae bacterium]
MPVVACEYVQICRVVSTCAVAPTPEDPHANGSQNATFTRRLANPASRSEIVAFLGTRGVARPLRTALPMSRRPGRSISNYIHMVVAPIALLVVTFSATLGYAEDLPSLPSPLKPDDVLTYARTHRGEIVAAKARARAAAESPKIVTALPDPMVMVSVDHLPFKLDGVNASLMVQQDFPLSGVLSARRRAAEADARAYAADAKTVSLDVEYQALAAYLMVVELQRMSVIVDEQTRLARQIVAVTRARLGGADAGVADVVRAELDLARLEAEKKTLLAETSGAAAMLDAALGRPVSGAAPTCTLVVPAGEPPTVPTLVAMASEGRPELAAMNERVSKARADVDVMSSMYKPMGFVRVGSAYTMTEGAGLMLMVGVSVPIWREKLGAGVSEARSMVAMADAERSSMGTMIQGDVVAAREALVAARIRFETSRDSLVPLARKTVDLMITSYGSGQTPLVSVLEAVRTFRDVRMEEVVAEVKLASAWARLGRTVGVVKVGVE